MSSPISPSRLLIALCDLLIWIWRLLRGVFNLVRGATRARRGRPRFPTWMIPIRQAGAHCIPERDLRELLADSAQIQRVFSSCPMVHMARLRIISDIHPALGNHDGARLMSHYLLFIAELDGHHNDFVDHLFHCQPNFVRRLLGNCVGFSAALMTGPSSAAPYRSPVYLRRYLARCTIDSKFPLFVFDESAGQIQAALDCQRIFSECVPAWQHLGQVQLLNEWQRFYKQTNWPTR